MTLPKWAKAHLAVNKLLNKAWGKFRDLEQDTQDEFKRRLFEAWRMGYRAGIRSIKEKTKK